MKRFLMNARNEATIFWAGLAYFMTMVAPLVLCVAVLTPIMIPLSRYAYHPPNVGAEFAATMITVAVILGISLLISVKIVMPWLRRKTFYKHLPE